MGLTSFSFGRRSGPQGDRSDYNFVRRRALWASGANVPVYRDRRDLTIESGFPWIREGTHLRVLGIYGPARFRWCARVCECLGVCVCVCVGRVCVCVCSCVCVCGPGPNAFLRVLVSGVN